MLYKVNYYTLGIIKHTNENNKEVEYEIGNIKQYSDVFYTAVNIEDIPELLELTVANQKGLCKYKPIITNIERIEGHL